MSEAQVQETRKRIVVVGGGITGLSSAYYALRQAEADGIDVELVLVEKDERLGGKIRTLHRDGCVIETGPDSIMARKMPTIHLTRELGFEDEWVATNPSAKTSYIMHKSKLHPMPLGLVLGIPTAVTPFMMTGLISPLGKLRAGLDLILPRGGQKGDESLGSFIHRRLGKEVLDNITEPLLAGIYAGDTKQLSLQATFPQFHQMEQKYRSLILGMMNAGPKRPAPANKAPSTTPSTAGAGGVGGAGGGLPPIAAKSMFIGYRRGLSSLIDRMATDIAPKSTILTGVTVTSMLYEHGQHVLQLSNGERLEADGVVLSTPAFETARLLPDSPALSWLKAIPYVSVANVVMAFRAADIGFTMDASGYVIPRKEGRHTTACTWISTKWPHTVPEGIVLVRCYVGRSGAEDWVNWSDQQLLDTVRNDLKDIMGVKAQPMFHEISRWPQSMPQYPVGHVEKLREVREELAKVRPGVMICGSGYQGVGIPDCVNQGKVAAEQLVAWLQKKA